MAKLQGQKVSSGFWSGFVASGFVLGLRPVGLSSLRSSDAAPKSFGLEKGTFLNAVIGGTTSELTGGKFANGAVTGAFVHLFNFYGKSLEKYSNPKNLNSNISGSLGIGGGIHALVAGVSFHYNVVNNSLTICCRVGPGIYLGMGSEVGFGYGQSESNWSLGAGGDVAFGPEGVSASVAANNGSVAVSGNYKLPASSGLGVSLGIDGCYTFK